jgi:hypothetical protein
MMSTTVPDAAIKAAAYQIDIAHDPFSQEAARAALTAAMPAIREAIAQEIEDYHAIGSVDWHRDWKLGRDIAARIVRGES